MQLARLAVPALIGMFLFGGFALYTNGQNTSLANQYNGLVGKYNDLLPKYNQAESTIGGQSATIAQLRLDLNASSIVYNDLLRNYTRTNIIYRSPGSNNSIAIWGKPFILHPGRWEQWELLDTFVNHLQFSANQTVRLMVMNLNEYANFVEGKPFSPNVNMTGTDFSFNAYFTEGCGVYVLILQNTANSTAFVQPNVTATYAWTPFATGSCSFP
jgi:hypothetical protein